MLIALFDNLNINVVKSCWDNQCQDQIELVRLSDQIKELCSMRDSTLANVLTRPEAQEIIDLLCTV